MRGLTHAVALGAAALAATPCQGVALLKEALFQATAGVPATRRRPKQQPRVLNTTRERKQGLRWLAASLSSPSAAPAASVSAERSPAAKPQTASLLGTSQATAAKAWLKSTPFAVNSRGGGRADVLAAPARRLSATEKAVRARQQALYGWNMDSSGPVPQPDVTAHKVNPEVVGREAWLDPNGYAEVASTRSASAMMQYAFRLMQIDLRLRVTDRSGFLDMLPYFDGTCETQSFEHLRAELQRSQARHACRKAWAAPTAKGLYVVRKNDPVASQRARVNQVFRSLKAKFSDAQATKNSTAMAELAGKVVQQLGGVILDKGALSGLIPYYSGVNGSQPFHRMVEELQAIGDLDDGWLRFGGDVAQLSEIGYRAVALMGEDSQMKSFIERVVENVGLAVTDPDGVRGLVPFHSGECTVQSLQALKRELRAAVHRSRKCGGGWLKPM